jgi:hypothetical protein
LGGPKTSNKADLLHKAITQRLRKLFFFLINPPNPGKDYKAYDEMVLVGKPNQRAK